jgi:hypothetical protein
MHKRRIISAALFALALAGCQGRGLQPQATSAATPSTNDTIPVTTSEPARAEEQSSTTVETTSTTAEIIPETVPVTRVRATVPATTATVLTTSVPRSNASAETGEWAIPTYIVMCESGGRWDAYNPSGASGPYQLMPMHFGGALAMNQSRAAQHAKAAELWDGGRGRNHWRACL